MRSLVFVPALAMLASACAERTARVEARSPADLRASAAVAGQVRRCYRAPRVPSTAQTIVTRLIVSYTSDGTLVGVPTLVSQQGVTPESQPYASRMAEAAKLAVLRCNPVRLPPEAGKGRGSDFFLTFSPRRNA
ncbi:MAG TPA: hypothetical protein VF574_15440 [Allosphingosinicella sp.]|jgi:hypothetical protein